jgi:hypothetical protein
MLAAAGVTVTVGVVGWLRVELVPPHAATARLPTATANSAE